MKRIAVYCGSRHGADPAYTAVARELGGLLAERGIAVVYGGGSVGLMGEVADAALAAGGEVIGVIPQLLWEKEVGHRALTALHVVEGMHERKAMMMTLADGFIALPGGAGTLDELFEVLTWAQLAYHRKPCGLINVNGYYDGLVAFLQHTVAQGFLQPQHYALMQVESTATAMLGQMLAVKPTVTPA